MIDFVDLHSFLAPEWFGALAVVVAVDDVPAFALSEFRQVAGSVFDVGFFQPPAAEGECRGCQWS